MLKYRAKYVYIESREMKLYLAQQSKGISEFF